MYEMQRAMLREAGSWDGRLLVALDPSKDPGAVEMWRNITSKIKIVYSDMHAIRQ